MTPLPVQDRPQVRRDYQQVLGLSSCPTDEHGSDCELCKEQIDRLCAAVEAEVRYVREAERWPNHLECLTDRGTVSFDDILEAR